MLNKANEDGYVVLTLKNEQNEFLTIFAKILNDNHKLEIGNSIHYGEITEFISTDRLDSFLYSYDDWKDSVDDENLIKYRAKILMYIIMFHRLSLYTFEKNNH